MTVRVKEIGARNKENTEVRDRAEGHVYGGNDHWVIGYRGVCKCYVVSEMGGWDFIKGS